MTLLFCSVDLMNRETTRPMPRRKKEPEETFGRRLARLRKARGITQAGLARQIGISRRMMAYWEVQTDRPPAHLLTKLSELLGYSFDEFLGVKPIEVEAPDIDMRFWLKLQKTNGLSHAGRKALIDYLELLLTKYPKQQKEA